MNKATQYARNGALIVGAINATLNAIKQHNEIKGNPQLEFNWRRFFLAMAKGAIVGGIGGFGLGSYVDHKNSLIKPLNTDRKLLELANGIRLDKTSPAYLKLNGKVEGLRQVLLNEYGSLIKSTPRLGSTVNGTALQSNFDADLGVNFKPKSFGSTEKMFSSVLQLFEKKIGAHSIVRVRDQKKSIGVFVNIDGKEVKIDVVPCKLTLGAKGSGYLHINNPSVIGKGPSFTKTNMRVLNGIRLSETQKKIVVLLKKWRDKNDLPISSHLLVHLVIDAYSYASTVPTGFTKKVVMVLKHIANKLDVAVIRGVENSNNILTKISDEKKSQIIEACRDAIEEYNYQRNSIISTLR